MSFLWKTARSCASLSLFKYKSPAGTKPVGLKETGSQMLPDQNRWANKALPYNLNCARAVKQRILLPLQHALDELVNSIRFIRFIEQEKSRQSSRKEKMI